MSLSLVDFSCTVRYLSWPLILVCVRRSLVNVVQVHSNLVLEMISIVVRLETTL